MFLVLNNFQTKYLLKKKVLFCKLMYFCFKKNQEERIFEVFLNVELTIERMVGIAMTHQQRKEGR